MGKEELKKIFGKKVIFKRQYFKKNISDCGNALVKILKISGYVLVGIWLIPCPN